MVKLDKRTSRIHRILLSTYGRPHHRKSDPVETLILTILSQNTSDRNRDTAYLQLKKRFPDPASLANAPVGDIRASIRAAGLSKSKSTYIKQAMKRIIKDNGKPSLDFLKPMSLPRARSYLMSMNGVGPKTAAVVLCFSLGMPALPVDTHVYRVSKRLGLIPEKATREKAHDALEHRIPPDWCYPFHINMIEHGRRVCKARKPQCSRCPLALLCTYKHKSA